MLFMNTVQELFEDSIQDPKVAELELNRVMHYRPLETPRLSQYDPQATLNVVAMNLVRDRD
jgi:hypothetical protein